MTLPAQAGGAPARSTLLVAAMLVGCAHAPTRVLIALPPADAPAPAAEVRAVASLPHVLLVRRLVIPEYMAAPKVRYWSGPATLAEWPDTYWAERVEIGMAREFVAALQRRLPGWTVCDASCGDTPVDLTLKVELQRLDMVRREQTLSGSARAAFSGPQAATSAVSTLAISRSLSVALPADTPQGQARAMSDLLGQLADATVAAIPRGGLPPGVGAGPP
jgi:uncharacterized lipoprotein YmbA